MSDEPKKRWSLLSSWRLCWTPILLLLAPYVALEPPIHIWCNHHDCAYVAMDLYAPVEWVKGYSEEVTDFFDWYDGLWNWQTEKF
jgi:hypothetical protein